MRSIHTAVVTGPTGAIGHALCARLLQKGVTVYAVCRPGSLRAPALQELNGINLLYCDTSELGQLPTLLPISADAFFHLAWIRSDNAGRNDLDAQVRNIQYTLDACRAAVALGCQVFVGAGSQAEYGKTDQVLTPETPCFPEIAYGMAKLCAGQVSRLECRKSGLAHIWPRILSVYGPYTGNDSVIMSTIRILLSGGKPALTAGEQLWDYLYCEDAAEALYRMALYGRNNAVYPLGFGHSRPMREYAEILRDAVDPALPLGLGEVPYSAGQRMRLEADLRSLREDTGFVPKVLFQDGIKKTVDWMRNQEGSNP